MASNGYEIRLTILNMAKDMLYEGWHARQNAALHVAAQNKNGAYEMPPAPSFAEIEDLARKLYGFVEQRASTPKPAYDSPSDHDFYGHALRNPVIPPGQ